MEVINAIWEKRNLGVSCYEININKSDSVSDLECAIKRYIAEYMVIKIPAGMPEFIIYLQERGFYYIETITQCYYDVRKNLDLSSIQKRVLSKMEYQRMSQDDIENLYLEIQKGIFDTDRVSLDPFFSAEQASRRYIGWIKDEVERNSDIYKVINNNCQTIGFFIYKDLDKIRGYSCLGGAYKIDNTLGTGFTFPYYSIQEGKKRGQKKIFSAYSSNNRKSVALHMSMGYILEEQYYIFIKHNLL